MTLVVGSAHLRDTKHSREVRYRSEAPLQRLIVLEPYDENMSQFLCWNSCWGSYNACSAVHHSHRALDASPGARRPSKSPRTVYIVVMCGQGPSHAVETCLRAIEVSATVQISITFVCVPIPDVFQGAGHSRTHLYSDRVISASPVKLKVLSDTSQRSHPLSLSRAPPIHLVTRQFKSRLCQYSASRYLPNFKASAPKAQEKMSFDPVPRVPLLVGKLNRCPQFGQRPRHQST